MLMMLSFLQGTTTHTAEHAVWLGLRATLPTEGDILPLLLASSRISPLCQPFTALFLLLGNDLCSGSTIVMIAVVAGKMMHPFPPVCLWTDVPTSGNAVQLMSFL